MIDLHVAVAEARVPSSLFNAFTSSFVCTCNIYILTFFVFILLYNKLIINLPKKKKNVLGVALTNAKRV